MNRLTMTATLLAATLAIAGTTRAMGDGQVPAKPAPAQDVQKKDEAPVRSVEKGDKAELGKVAPDFKLKGLDGKELKLSDFKGKKVVIEWINPACPFVQYAYEKGPLKDMRKRYAEKGVVWLCVNSGAAGKEGSDPKDNLAFAEKHGLKGSILVDADGVVGRAYGAKTTPQMFLIDEKAVLAYMGGLDNAPMGKSDTDIRVNHVDAALLDLEAGKPVKTPQAASYGCGVKYARKQPGS